MSAINPYLSIFTLGSDPRQIGVSITGLTIDTINVNNINPATPGGSVAIQDPELNGTITGDVLGAPDGLATLDPTGVIPLSQIPPSIIGSNTFNVYVRLGPGSAAGTYTGGGPNGPGHTITADNAVINLTVVGIDGITALVAGDRVLVDDGTANTNNGIYTITALTGPWVMTRATDFDDGTEVVYGSNVYVASGTIAGGEGYRLVTADPITVDVTPLQFNKFTNTYTTITAAIQSNETLLYANDPVMKTIFTFISPGTTQYRPPSNMTFVYNISGNTGLTPLNWQLVDITNNIILLTGSITSTAAYTNDTTQTVSLASIFGTWPAGVAVIEFQAVYNPVGTVNTNIAFFRSILFY